MTRKKMFIIICVFAFFAVSYTACTAFTKWIFRGEPTYPKVPTESTTGKVILASRGCCFWAEDVTVSLLDEYGNKTVIIYEDSVYEYDIFECDNLPYIDTPIQVIMDFKSFYDIEETISFSVGKFLNTDEILKNGLLLRFGDGDLIVRAGNIKKLFSSIGVDGKWEQVE